MARMPLRADISSERRSKDLSPPRNGGAMDSDVLVGRVREEFRDMPGLRLTLAQASRLWGLELHICRALIESLVASAFLRWTPRGVMLNGVPAFPVAGDRVARSQEQARPEPE